MAVPVSVISAWGWSLCLSTVACRDPSDAKAEVVFIRGVPSRGGERKRLIIDGVSPKARNLGGFQSIHRSPFVPVSGPGDRCVLESWTSPRKTKHFIGVTDDAFEVLQVVACDTITATDQLQAEELSLGFRYMQQVSWYTHRIPPCGHTAALGQSMALPDGVWAFYGIDSPMMSKYQPEGVFAALVAGDCSARWIMATIMLHGWSKATQRWRTVCVRSHGCCLECAVRFAQGCQQGGIVGLVL